MGDLSNVRKGSISLFEAVLVIAVIVFAAFAILPIWR